MKTIRRRMQLAHSLQFIQDTHPQYMQADAEKAADAKLKETQEREASLAADHQHALEVKSSEMAAILEDKAKLQTLVDESAAAHKAHAELKELRVRSKCVSAMQCIFK